MFSFLSEYALSVLQTLNTYIIFCVGIGQESCIKKLTQRKKTKLIDVMSIHKLIMSANELKHSIEVQFYDSNDIYFSYFICCQFKLVYLIFRKLFIKYKPLINAGVGI